MKKIYRNHSLFISGAAIFFLFGALEIAAQPKGPVYNNVRYEDDYSFLNNGAARDGDPFNRLKKIPLTGGAELTLGGSYRFRFERDANRRFGASTPQSQSFYLNRLFLFADVQLGARARVFGEFKYAGIAGNDLPAPPSAHDRPDVQNLFAEIWPVRNAGNKAGLRLGRQEMQFGRQRLISPLDWANTRRTFDGGRVLIATAGWKIDGFFTRHVELDPEEVNRADDSQTFSGVYAQRPLNGKTFSVYYLSLQEDDALARAGNGAPGDYHYHTLGIAYEGARKSFDWTTEAAYQFGSFSVDDISAYMLALEGGYTLNKIWAKPRLALGFDLASGDKAPSDDKKQTFNQLFPLGHAHLGWADQVGRQNIKSLSVLLTAKPHKRIVAKAQGFKFFLAQKKDALYNAGGGASRRDLTGSAGDEAGSEFDAEVTLNLNVHTGLVAGYTRFMPGDFIKRTGPAQTHNLFYVMVPVRF